MLRLWYILYINLRGCLKAYESRRIFSWTEDQHITVINPTSEDFKFKVHAKEYQLGAGKSAKMPGYIAWVYVYNMASQLCQADNKYNSWNEEGFRQKYYEKLVVGVDAIVQDVVDEPEPAVHVFEDDKAGDEEGDEPEQPKTSSSSVKPMSAKAKDAQPSKV
jgi:hypothetical protein